MPGIDASIYQQLGQGVTPIKGPQEIAAQALQLRHLRAQADLQDQQLASSKQAQAEQQQLRDVAKTATSPEDLEAKVLAVGTPAAIKMHHELTTARLTTEKAQRESAVTQTLLEKNQNDAASQVTGGIMSLPPEQRAAAWPDALAKFAAIDPEKAKAAAEKYPQYPGDDVVAQMHAFTQTEAQRLQVAAQTQLKAHQDATLAETMRHNKETEKTAFVSASRPSASMVMQQMGDLPAGFDPSQPLSAGLEPTAQLMGRGERHQIDPSTRTPHSSELNARADYLAKQNGLPGVLGPTEVAERQAGKKDFGSSGKNGQLLQSINVAASHLSLLNDLGEALHNGDTKIINELSNRLKTATGNPSANNYATVQLPVVTEVLRVAKGAGMINENEEKYFLKVAEGANSPKQLQGVIDNLTKIMGARPKAMEQTYGRYYPGHSVGEKLTPEAIKAFKRVGITFAPPAQANASGGSEGSPAIAPGAPTGAGGGGLPPGVKEQGQEGAVKWYRWASDGRRHTALPPAGGN